MPVTAVRAVTSRPVWPGLLLLGLALLGLGPTAHADDLGRARRHFDRGVVLYRQGRFDAALAEFERSQRLRPSPGLHYNLGQAQRALRRHGQAYTSFQRYLADNPDLPGGRRALVQQILEELRPHLAWVQLRDLPAGATVRVDGRRVEARAGVPLALDAGSHVIEVVTSGGTRTEEVVAAPGQSLTVVAALTRPPATGVLPRPEVPPAGPASPSPAPAPSPVEPVVVAPPAVVVATPTVPVERRPFYRRWWFWTAVGVVVVGGIVAGAAAGASHGPSGSLSPGTHQFR